jgi:predicted ester cyclase
MGIPATHKTFEAGALAIFEIDRGRIVTLRGQFDQLGMMRQLGVIP